MVRLKVAPDADWFSYPLEVLSQGARYYKYFGKMPETLEDILYTDTTLQDEIAHYLDGLDFYDQHS